MVETGSSIRGYSHTTAAARAPAKMHLGVEKLVLGLSELGVTQKSPSKTSDTLRHAQELRGDLKAIIGGKKADGVVNELSATVLNTDLHRKIDARLKGPDRSLASFVKDTLHFSFGEVKSGKLDTGDRMMVRSALVLAFAHGASKSEMTELRSRLTSGDADFRKSVIESLSVPKASVTDMLSTIDADLENVEASTTEEIADIVNWVNAGVDAYVASVDPSIIRNTSYEMEIGRKVREFLQLPGNSGLSPVGATAISGYTSEACYVLNNKMREGKVLNRTEREIVKQGKDFLAQLPDFRGIVCRGSSGGWSKEALKTYQKGHVVHEPTFCSTSASKGFDGAVQFIIESLHGKDVSPLSLSGFKDGREILFPPGTKFEVLGVEQGDDTHMYLGTADGTGGTRVENKDGAKTIFIVLREVE